MHTQNFVKIDVFVLKNQIGASVSLIKTHILINKILSVNEILTSIKGDNFLENDGKISCN